MYTHTANTHFSSNNVHLALYDPFKDDFLNISNFLHPQIPDFQILSYHNKPYINGNMMYYYTIKAYEIASLMTGFVVQGHILVIIHVVRDHKNPGS